MRPEVDSKAEAREAAIRRDVALVVVRMLAGMLVLVGSIALLGWLFGDELESFGRWFVGRFGLLGMAAGAFLADGLHVPLPPQFYLLTGLAGGIAVAPALASVLLGSILGGLSIFTVARETSHAAFFERRIGSTRALVRRLVDSYGGWGLAVAGLLPVSYFVLCVLGGAMRLPYRAYAVFALMRIPRLVVSIALIALAWRA